MFHKTTITGVNDDEPKYLLYLLELDFCLPRSFYTHREWAKYVTERMRLLSLIRDTG